MANKPSNDTLAKISCTWDGTTLKTAFNNGFEPPVDLTGVGSFRTGDVALIPDDVTGDISQGTVGVICNAVGTLGTSPLRYTGGPPPTACSHLTATATLKDASASNPNSHGRKWLLIESNDLSVDNSGALAVTALPGRVPFFVALLSNQSKLPANPSALRGLEQSHVWY